MKIDAIVAQPVLAGGKSIMIAQNNKLCDETFGGDDIDY
jgi:hypothetical protein